MSQWLYVLAAYAVTAGVLLGYTWRVQRRLRVYDRRDGRSEASRSTR